MNQPDVSKLCIYVMYMLIRDGVQNGDDNAVWWD